MFEVEELLKAFTNAIESIISHPRAATNRLKIQGAFFGTYVEKSNARFWRDVSFFKPRLRLSTSLSVIWVQLSGRNVSRIIGGHCTLKN